ncbi:MAG: hypothetical protein EXR72_24005 [Myxococcales bacterium]|nr:hypothetical protein [Myxococcales bacterium]
MSWCFLLARQEATTVEAERVRAAQGALSRRVEELQFAWRAAWHASGISPLPPKEMLAWLERHERLIGLVQKLSEAESQRDATARRVDRHREALAEALLPLGEVPDPEAPLAALIELAVAVSRALATARQLREQLVARTKQLDAGRVDLEQAAEQAGAMVAAWSAEWIDSMAALGLPATAAPEEANATVVEIDDLGKELDKRAQIDRRIEGMERNAREFVAAAEALVGAHAQDLRPATPSLDAWLKAAERLRRRYDQGRTDQSTAEEVAGELDQKRVALTGEEQRGRRAAARLSALQAAAGAPDLAALKEMELRSQRAATVTRDLRAVEDGLLAAGEGRTIALLIEETAGADVDRAGAEITQLEERIEQIHLEQQDEATQIGGLREGLRQVEERQSAAVDAAADVQEQLARVRGYADRYVRVHLASVLLQREIERYRERNQGPLLSRASDVFRSLTGGSFRSLRTAFDDGDKAVLRCVAADGGEKDVAGLSTGTQDQLYLALRIASLEQSCRANEPLPLILDDVLLTFDEPRAQHTLAVLGDLAARMQILYFTHLERDVTLARAAVPSGMLREHRL